MPSVVDVYVSEPEQVMFLMAASGGPKHQAMLAGAALWSALNPGRPWYRFVIIDDCRPIPLKTLEQGPRRPSHVDWLHLDEDTPIDKQEALARLERGEHVKFAPAFRRDADRLVASARRKYGAMVRQKVYRDNEANMTTEIDVYVFEADQ